MIALAEPPNVTSLPRSFLVSQDRELPFRLKRNEIRIISKCLHLAWRGVILVKISGPALRAGHTEPTDSPPPRNIPYPQRHFPFGRIRVRTEGEDSRATRVPARRCPEAYSRGRGNRGLSSAERVGVLGESTVRAPPRLRSLPHALTLKLL